MENVIIFLIIVVFIVLNFVKNYKKEKEKNKVRIITKPSICETEVIPVPTPFSRKVVFTPVTNEIIKETAQQPILVEESAVQMQMNKYLLASELIVKDQTTDFSIEGDAASSEAVAFNNSSDERQYSRNTSFDLELDTPHDYRRAFIHSLIFERKY